MEKFLNTARSMPASVRQAVKTQSKKTGLRFEVHTGLDLDSLTQSASVKKLIQESADTCRLQNLALQAALGTAGRISLRRPFSQLQRWVFVYANNNLKAILRVSEGRLFGMPTGYFRGGPAKGNIAVIAEPGSEEQWLKTGLGLLLSSHRVFAFQLNYDGEGPLPGALPEDVVVLRKPTQHYWEQPLNADFEATIAKLGRRTRRNLRYVLAQACKRNWQFVPDLSPHQLSEAVEALRSTSSYPFSAENAKARVRHSTGLPGYFAMGLRTAEGKWLSCMVGTRSTGSTDVIWQLNSPDKKLSICTAMRALLLQHESKSGSARIRLICGTTPQMEHHCTPVPGTTIALFRKGLRYALLRLLPASLLKRGSSSLAELLLDSRHDMQLIPDVAVETRKAPAA